MDLFLKFTCTPPPFTRDCSTVLRYLWLDHTICSYSTNSIHICIRSLVHVHTYVRSCECNTLYSVHGCDHPFSILTLLWCRIAYLNGHNSWWNRYTGDVSWGDWRRYSTQRADPMVLYSNESYLLVGHLAEGGASDFFRVSQPHICTLLHIFCKDYV